MKRLTQDQKQYRKRKKEAKKDVIRVRKDNGEIALRVAKRPLCLRVSEEVFNALTEVGAFYWTDLAPDIVNSGREEQGSISV